jgi:hypothetical protein
VLSSPLTRLSVAQTLPAEDAAERLSSTFHRRLPWLLSGRAIIESVSRLADLAHDFRRPWRDSPRAARTGAAIVATLCLALPAAACGGSSAGHVAQLGSATTTTQSVPASTTSAQSAQLNAALAFSRCMRSHGVPNFPDTDPRGDFPSFQTHVPKQTSAAADDACKHLLSRGGSTGTPQQRRQKLAFGLKVAQCLRRHGFPDFPDPTGSSQHMPPGINTDSPQFQSAETACETQVRQALGLP